MALLGHLLVQRRSGRAAALVLLGVAVMTTGPALDLTLAAAVVSELAAGLAFVVASLWLVRRGDTTEATASLITGLGLALLGVSWAFAWPG